MIPPLQGSDAYAEQCRNRQVVLVRALEAYFVKHQGAAIPELSRVLDQVPTCWAQPALATGTSFPIRISRKGCDYWLQTFCVYHHTSVERLSEDRNLRPAWADDIPWLNWKGNPPPER